uniref:Portal protein n=1 Tax=viral metagenome TaxID=1070528 RepID=A0A6H1ZIZ3_9ZZZZ
MSKDSNVIQLVKDKEDNLREYFELQRLMWDRNIFFHMGQQWIELDLDSRSWRDSKYRYSEIDPLYPTPVTNITFDKVQTILSNITKSFPSPYATHRVGSDKAKQSARYADVALKYFEEKKDMKTKVSDTALQCMLLGGCILKPYWDLETGKYREELKTKTEKRPQDVPIKVCPDCNIEYRVNVPQCLQCGNGLVNETKKEVVDVQVPVISKDGIPQTEHIPIGDPNCELTSYYEWLFDPLVDELDKQRWKMRRRVKSAKWIENTYGVKVKADPTLADEYWHMYKINFWHSTPFSFKEDITRYLYNFMQDAVPFIEYWEKPETTKDKGRYLILAGEQKVADRDFPYEDGKWREIHVRFAKEILQFYGIPFINLLIGPNVRINKIDQQIEWNRQTVIDPITVNPTGSGVEQEEFYGRLGRYIEPNPAVSDKIGYLHPEPYPAQVYQERQNTFEDIDKLTISDSFSGKLPETRTAAASIEMAIEQNAAKLSLFGSSLGLGFTKVYREWVQLMRYNMPVERKFSIMGEEQEYESIAFSGEELWGDPDYDDGGLLIRIDYDSIYPKSRAADKQMMIELLQYGFINPQDDFMRSLVFQKFGFDKEGVNQGFNSDLSCANREVIRMKNGIDVSADYAKDHYNIDLSKMNPQDPQFDPTVGLKPGQNHFIHLEVVRKYVQSEEFEHQPPEVQQIFLRHLSLEQVASQRQRDAQMEEQIKLAQQAKGAPGGIIKS